MPIVTASNPLTAEEIRHKDLMESLDNVVRQLAVLNERFEEAFRTNIAIEDIDNGDD